MQVVRSKLNNSGLGEENAIKEYDFIKRLKMFIQDWDKENRWSSQGVIEKDKKLFVKIVIQQLQNTCHNIIEKHWLKLLFVDSLINHSTSNTINDLQFINFLDTLCQQVTTVKNNCPSKMLSKQTKSKSFIGKFSTGLSKISSIINLSYFNEQQEQYNKKNYISKLLQNNSQQQKKSLSSVHNNDDDIQLKLLTQYGVYLRKKLVNYKFFLKVIQKHQNNEHIQIDSDAHMEQLRENVWKIINLFGHHTVMVKLYKKIAFVENQQTKPLIAMLNMLCRDCLILYPYVVKLIGIQMGFVKERYRKIVGDSRSNNIYGGKDIKRLRLIEFSRSMMFVEVDNLLKELTPVNETIFFLFCGKLHCRYIHIEVPSNYFLNTANPVLDDIHNILRQVKLITQKQQKSKLYRTQMSIKLDQSVSRVVQKMDTTRNIKLLTKQYNYKTIFQSHGSIKKIQTFKKKQSLLRKNIVYSQFEQKTQDV